MTDTVKVIQEILNVSRPRRSSGQVGSSDYEWSHGASEIMLWIWNEYEVYQDYRRVVTEIAKLLARDYRRSSLYRSSKLSPEAIRRKFRPIVKKAEKLAGRPEYFECFDDIVVEVVRDSAEDIIDELETYEPNYWRKDYE